MEQYKDIFKFDDINKGLKPKLEEYMELYNNKEIEFSKKKQNCIEFMKGDNSALANGYNEFYQFRSDLSVHIKNVKNTILSVDKVRKKMLYQVTFTETPMTQAQAKNKEEREIRLKYQLRDIDFLLGLCENHLELVNDILSDMTRMIYGTDVLYNLRKG